MPARLMRLDTGIANEIVEVMREFADVLGRGEDKIHVANIDRSAQRTKDRIGHRKTLAIVEQEPAIGRIEAFGEFCCLVELRQAVVLGEATPNPFASGKAIESLKRRADLDFVLATLSVDDARSRNAGPGFGCRCLSRPVSWAITASVLTWSGNVAGT